MRADRSGASSISTIESLECRRLLALSVGPLSSTAGARFNAVQTDSDGNIYAVGDFQGTTTFDQAGKVKLTARGNSDAFIMRIAASNGAMIVRSLFTASITGGGNKVVTPTTLIVKDGHVTVVGGFTGTADLDPTKGVKNATEKGGGDIFVLDLSAASLNYNWSIAFGGSGADSAQGMARDSKGNTWLTGYFQNSITIPSKHTLTSGGSFDAFILKLDSAGKYAFSTRVGGAGDDVLHSVATDSHDNVFFSGSFQQTIDTDPGKNKVNLTTAGTSTSPLLIELNSAGAFKASRGFIDTGFGSLTDIEIDKSDAIYLLGNYDGTIDVDAGSKVKNFTTKGFGDIWLGKLDAKLNPVFNFTLGAAGTDQGNDLEIDSKGQILFCGVTDGGIDLNPASAKATVTSDGASDIFAASYNSAGKFLGAAQLGGAGATAAVGIARTGANFLVAGNFQNSFDLTPRPIPASGTPTHNLIDSQNLVLGVLSLISTTMVGSK